MNTNNNTNTNTDTNTNTNTNTNTDTNTDTNTNTNTNKNKDMIRNMGTEKNLNPQASNTTNTTNTTNTSNTSDTSDTCNTSNAINKTPVIYNSLSREKEKLKTLEDNLVKIYSCGPTVYNFAHIGNLRTYVFMDILRRTLKYAGFKILHVMNITDVGHLVSDEDEGEDKMLKGAREQKKTPWEIADFYTEAFMSDIAKLNIETPEIVPKATEHVDIMIDFVKGLVDKGYGYETGDGIYFDIGRFDGYGKLSRLDLDEQIAGARVGVNIEKRHPADFALWKKAPKEHIMQWDSPWGMGYPGWHIECSAMGMKYLGETFDIHTGGVDHIPIHHENEIAQSEALIGKPSVSYWMHGEFMMVDNGKMSKSLGNTYVLEDIKNKGADPLAFRYFCLNAHYRNKLNFTWDAIKSASVSYRRFIEGAISHKNAGQPLCGEDSRARAVAAKCGKDSPTLATAAKCGEDSPAWAATAKCSEDSPAWAAAAKYGEEFDAAILDDLNIPKALGIAWNVIRNPEKTPIFYNLLLNMDTVLGLGIQEAAEAAEKEAEEIARTGIGFTADPGIGSGMGNGKPPEDVTRLLTERAEARAAKDFKKSDEIRDILKQMGYEVKDTKDGAVVTKF